MATRGLSLFCNLNAKLALLGIIRGHIGMKLGRIGPWPLPEVPFGFYWILATRGLSLFINLNAKLFVLGIVSGCFGMKFDRIGPWPYGGTLWPIWIFGHQGAKII